MTHTELDEAHLRPAVRAASKRLLAGLARRACRRPGAHWLPVAAWAYLLAGRGPWWRMGERLPPRAAREPSPGHWPSVAVVVPARNEAAVLEQALPALLAQQYPGHAWVVLVDDESTDGTAELARRLAARGGGRGLGLTIVQGTPRPPGWAGKPWAMHQGLSRALEAPGRPEWVLFTDADIAHPADSLHQLVAGAVAGRRSAVSLMARLPTDHPWEKLLVPAFVYFFDQLYPFPLVNDPARRAAAAAGGCLLVNVETLTATGGIAPIGDRTIDDVALAKRLKAAGADIWLGLARGAGGGGLEVRSTRAYGGLAPLWDMVARNAYTQLGYNPLALAGVLAALGAVYVAPPLMVARGALGRRPATALAGAVAWAAMATSYRPAVRYHGGPRGSEWALPFTAVLYGAMTATSAVRHRRGTTSWKGRPGAGAGPGGRR